MRYSPLLLCALALAGCGGRGGPAIDRDVATKLARQADAIASAQDGCARRTHARILQRQTIAAINAGRIPAAYQEALQARVNELAAELELSCLPTPAAQSEAPPPAVVQPVAHAPKPKHEKPRHEKPKHEHREHGKKRH
jgi:hypothetical protein